MWPVVKVTTLPLFPLKRWSIQTSQEAEWVLGSVCTGVENFAPTGTRSPDRPAYSKSLYRLSYPGPHLSIEYFNFATWVSLILPICYCCLLWRWWRRHTQDEEVVFFVFNEAYFKNVSVKFCYVRYKKLELKKAINWYMCHWGTKVSFPLVINQENLQDGFERNA